MSDTPKPGEPISMEDVDMIIDAIGKRRENFPEEPANLCIALVLKNIGDRFTPVECIEQEWKGIKFDIPNRGGDGIPICPNGHPLMQSRGVTLGWVEEV